MIYRYADNPSLDGRAQQAWLILISAARMKQTVVYGDLAEAMGWKRKDERFLGAVLDRVLAYCMAHDLPHLPAIVVQTASGVPGGNYQLRSDSVAQDRAEAQAFDWYSIAVPSRKQLRKYCLLAEECDWNFANLYEEA